MTCTTVHATVQHNSARQSCARLITVSVGVCSHAMYEHELYAGTGKSISSPMRQTRSWKDGRCSEMS